MNPHECLDYEEIILHLTKILNYLEQIRKYTGKHFAINSALMNVDFAVRLSFCSQMVVISKGIINLFNTAFMLVCHQTIGSTYELCKSYSRSSHCVWLDNTQKI